MLWRRSAWLGLEEEYEGQAFDIRVKGLEKIDGKVPCQEDSGPVCQEHRELRGVKKTSISRAFTTNVTCKL